jgi:hypothetical protein
MLHMDAVNNRDRNFTKGKERISRALVPLARHVRLNGLCGVDQFLSGRFSSVRQPAGSGVD